MKLYRQGGVGEQFAGACNGVVKKQEHGEESYKNTKGKKGGVGITKNGGKTDQPRSQTKKRKTHMTKEKRPLD